MTTLDSIPRSGFGARRRPGSSRATASVVAGTALAVMAGVAAWANFGALTPLIGSGDAVRTAAAIAEAEVLFRAGAAAMLLVAVLDVVVAIALLVVFEPVGRAVAIASAAFRAAYAAGLVVAISELVMVPSLLPDPDQVMRAVDRYHAVWQTSLVLFAVHLLLIGHLAFRSGFLPRVFGILLVIAGLGYLADGIGAVVVPGFSPTFALVTFVGELALIFWLLISGRRLADGASDVV